jgi:hypothetical protein
MNGKHKLLFLVINEKILVIDKEILVIGSAKFVHAQFLDVVIFSNTGE